LNQEKIHGKLVTGAWSICLSNKNHHFRALLVSYQVQTAGTEEKSRGGAGNRGEEQGRSREQRRGAGEDLGPWGFSLGRTRPTGRSAWRDEETGGEELPGGAERDRRDHELGAEERGLRDHELGGEERDRQYHELGGEERSLRDHLPSEEECSRREQLPGGVAGR